MKSRTSFSKLTPFRKNLTRFAPIWALYIIGMFLVFSASVFLYDEKTFLYSYLRELFPQFAIVNLVYAIIIAVMLFGDLYNTRLSYSMHAMPIRREGLFFSNLAAGFLFSLVPNILAMLYFMTRCGSDWFVSFYWLLSTQLQFIFYFGLAVFCVMLVGNRFAGIGIYAFLNFFSLIAYGAVELIYEPLLLGVDTVASEFYDLCPTVWLNNEVDFLVFREVSYFDEIEQLHRTYRAFQELGDGWGYLAILAGVGVVLMGVALALYRVRDLESAGDFVAFSVLKPVLSVVITVCAGLAFAFVGWAFGNDSATFFWLGVGMVVGHFGGLMLLERRLKVFRGKTIAGLAAVALVVYGSVALVQWDVFGIEDWLPEADQVKTVTIGNSSYSYDYVYGGGIKSVIDDPEDIEKILEAHEDILEHLDENHKETYMVALTYELTNGRVVRRHYWPSVTADSYEIIRSILYRPEAVLGSSGMEWDEFVDAIGYMYGDYGDVPENLHEKILTYLRDDVINGYAFTEGSHSYSDEDAYLQYDVSSDEISCWRSLVIKPGASVLEILNSQEVMLGFADLSEATFEYVYVAGVELEAAQIEPFMLALIADAEAGYLDNSKYAGSSFISVDYFVRNGAEGTYRCFSIRIDAENVTTWLKENGLM